jgi:hypothetical protein
MPFRLDRDRARRSFAEFEPGCPERGESSDDNQATLVSTGTTLKLDAKVDVTFDVVVGKAGMRVS